MPLSPPPDYSQCLLCLAIGLSVATAIGLISRNTLPHVGDLHHSLPHGGYYKDGTKTILYSGPRKLNSLEFGRTSLAQPWAICILLVALIAYLSRRGEKCPACNRQH
uniref:Triple gene block 2 n=1 Tax=Pitahaya virus E TaxID=3144105 RepID=A0AAU6WJ40_9VIRU